MHLGPHAETLLRRLRRSRRRTAGAYALGGAGFALVMTWAFLVSSGIEFAPVRSLLLFLAYAWPVVFTTTLALGSSLRVMLAGTAAYAAVFIALAAIAVARSPESSWSQVALFWAINNLPPSVLKAFDRTGSVHYKPEAIALRSFPGSGGNGGLASDGLNAFHQLGQGHFDTVDRHGQPIVKVDSQMQWIRRRSRWQSSRFRCLSAQPTQAPSFSPPASGRGAGCSG